ncbi:MULTISPECIES: adventurous gliding motility protein GltC [Myxococcus]|uniref:Adventurous gliding motility protein GltC n=2 Tax=Myxococcus TaxID=32 RepID=A0A540WIF9_9BACT|nr:MULTISPECIES: adventurous gliding motility protein GltC [Myxococcus]NTX04193.1 adventurous gliding motility protein GltC [Myxococcus sp. CA040A]NTX36362.1 adventurous gliding motility protein GltC [Myxococcus sp. CA033]TQF08796.1 adventurous gliding motility protein GltC [Myxococcus llanfairpwllgwyngyllgogerychwyrndrobwllllantysiliogogogochensis]
MLRSFRLIRLAVLGLALVWTAPSFAQNFEGLDLGGQSKSKKKKKGASTTRSSKASKSKKKPTRGSRGKTPPAPVEDDAPAEATGPIEATPAAVTGPTSPSEATPAPAPTPTPPAAPANSGGFGLDLTQETPKTPAPTMSFDAVDVSGKTADRQRLDITVSLFKNDEYEKAAMSAHELLADPKLAGLHTEARYVLAKSLYRMGMYHSSLGEFSKLLALGPSTKFFKTSLEWLFFISRKTKNETVILDEIARHANQEFPEKYRNEFRYLLARYHFVRGRALDQVGQNADADKSFAEVQRLTLLIPKTDAFYPRARYLDGLASFRNGSRQKDAAAKRGNGEMLASVEAMKEVVRLTRPVAGKSADQVKLDKSLRELAFMQLARTHYGMQQNRFALFYLGKVERGNTQWLESLFEASWANYRVGQFEQALGNLITLSSPFFREEYFPEALILKAVIYYENCRYRESNIILQDFERTYLPVHDQLESLVKKNMEAGEYYSVLADVQKKNKDGLEKNETDVILERILRLALTDQDLRKTNDSILELEGEMDAFASRGDTFKYSELSKSLLEELKVHRTGLISKAGIMAKGKLETELVALKQLLANGLRIKFETTTKEKEFLEDQLKAGGRTSIVKKYKFSVAVSDDQLYWPYEGEYWRDELGTYQYTLTKGCIDRDTANRNVQSAEAL